MTDWEQKQIFGKLDRLIELAEKMVDFNNGMLIGVDEASREGDYPVLIEAPEHDDEVKVKESRKASVAKADRDRYNIYREAGGELKWNEWRRKDKKGRVS